MNRYHFFDKFFFPLSLLINLLTLVSSLASHVSPVNSWMVALIGLMFPALYPVNAFFVFLWLMRRKFLLLLFPLIPFVSGFNTAMNFFPLHRTSQSSQDVKKQDALKVMTFNIRNFDVYNWSAQYYGTDSVKDHIIELIRDENPDVVCLQEFYTSDSGNYRMQRRFSGELGYKYEYVELPITRSKKNHWGMAIFSHHPLFNFRMIPFDNVYPGNPGKKSLNMTILADMQFGSDTIRIINTHLQSIRFREEDYRFVSDVAATSQEEKISGIKGIAIRLKIAYLRRADQCRIIKELTATSPHPVILCGDFNDTPSSFVYRQINQLLNDSYRDAGFGFGATYNGPFPAFRIDYIFYDPSLEVTRSTVLRHKLSDHFPVISEFRLHSR